MSLCALLTSVSDNLSMDQYVTLCSADLSIW